MDINITARNSEEFKQIEELLNELPEIVRSQVESAKFGVVGLDCAIRDNYDEKQRIYLPEGVTQICDFDNYVGVYCGDYFFKLGGSLYKRKHNFIINEGIEKKPVKKEHILKILNSYKNLCSEFGADPTAVDEDDFEKVADEIMKLLNTKK